MRPSQAADLLWACSSPELYDLLVHRRGWALTRYARFIVDVMIAGLLPRLVEPAWPIATPIITQTMRPAIAARIFVDVLEV